MTRSSVWSFESGISYRSGSGKLVCPFHSIKTQSQVPSGRISPSGHKLDWNLDCGLLRLQNLKEMTAIVYKPLSPSLLL